MLKFFFCCLLLANGLLFAFHQGYLDALIPSGREPARIANQLNASKIKLLSPSAATAAGAAAAPASTAPIAGQPATVAGCTEIGNFNAVDAKQFEAQLTLASLMDKMTRRDLREAGSHMVFIPPQEGKAGADKKADELRNLGITDFYVIQDGSEQRWGISLGIFKTEEAARMHMATLTQKGVRSARIVDYKVPSNKVVFQLRDLDANAKASLDKIKDGFPRQESRNCE